MEYWFYHLEASTVEGVLPGLLEKTRQKGWKALVKLPVEQLKEMDDYLWTYKDDSFLPHGRDDEPMSEQQPITLSSSAVTASGRQAVFLLGGTDLDDMSGVERCIVMINGRSQDDVLQERKRWRALKEAGATLSYYQQNDRGSWEKKA
ncbi:DNA polymerase III subunit chi [Hellea balneolensis]|uniref:DNA polymerase III subunit chi n=1 Tax=Hellea balneolensis TaxID=287478 RepID=UPI00040C1FA4|nr:DNA polymerase III subunit chi [Hellea balneolensis]